MDVEFESWERVVDGEGYGIDDAEGNPQSVCVTRTYHIDDDYSIAHRTGFCDGDLGEHHYCCPLGYLASRGEAPLHRERVCNCGTMLGVYEAHVCIYCRIPGLGLGGCLGHAGPQDYVLTAG